VSDPGPILEMRDIPRAAMLLTRLPAPGADDRRAAAAAWAWPLIGAVVGGLAATAAWTILGIGLPPSAAAGVALGVGVVATGGLHEDGLADCADGFWGGATPARRLEIMKDSRTGAYGILALILVLGLKWVLLTEALAAGPAWSALLLPAMASRAVMAGSMAVLPFARKDGEGIARRVGRPGRDTAALALAIALGAVLLLAGSGGGAAILGSLAAGGAVAWLARRKIGGQSGDVLGASQTLSELAGLATLVAVLA